MEKKILFTGGSGLLGQELQKLVLDGLFPTSKEFNVCDILSMKSYLESNPAHTVLHAAAFTSPPLVDKDPVKAITTNIGGTVNLVRLCIDHGIRLIYISTDYVFDGRKGNYNEDDPVHPVNKYAWSKLGGECAVRLYDNSLIVRTSFSENRFPYDKAFIDQWTSRQSVEVTAKQLVRLIALDYKGIVNVGGKRQTVFEYASSLNKNQSIGELSIKDVSFHVPKDTSLNSERFQGLINQ